MDGVTCLLMRDELNNMKISELVRSSKQFPQLHVLITSQRLAKIRQISKERLAKDVGLPVIAIKSLKQSGESGFDIPVNGRHVLVSATGLDRAKTETLYRLSCKPPSRVPEAIRIADLLAVTIRSVISRN